MAAKTTQTKAEVYFGEPVATITINGAGGKALREYPESLQINEIGFPGNFISPSRVTKKRYFQAFPLLESGTIEDIFLSAPGARIREDNLCFTQSEVGELCENSKLRSKLLPYNHDRGNISNFILLEGGLNNNHHCMVEVLYYTNGTRPSLQVVNPDRFLDAEKYNYHFWIRVAESSLKKKAV
jgi:hypothetical protein